MATNRKTNKKNPQIKQKKQEWVSQVYNPGYQEWRHSRKVDQTPRASLTFQEEGGQWEPRERWYEGDWNVLLSVTESGQQTQEILALVRRCYDLDWINSHQSCPSVGAPGICFCCFLGGMGCLKGALQREEDCGCHNPEQPLSALLADDFCAFSRNQNVFNYGFKWLSPSNK